MKKIISLVLVFVLLFSLCACGNSAAPEGNKPGNDTPQTQNPQPDEGNNKTEEKPIPDVSGPLSVHIPEQTLVDKDGVKWVICDQTVSEQDGRIAQQPLRFRVENKSDNHVFCVIRSITADGYMLGRRADQEGILPGETKEFTANINPYTFESNGKAFLPYNYYSKLNFVVSVTLEGNLTFVDEFECSVKVVGNQPQKLREDAEVYENPWYEENGIKYYLLSDNVQVLDNSDGTQLIIRPIVIENTTDNIVTANELVTGVNGKSVYPTRFTSTDLPAHCFVIASLYINTDKKIDKINDINVAFANVVFNSFESYLNSELHPNRSNLGEQPSRTVCNCVLADQYKPEGFWPADYQNNWSYTIERVNGLAIPEE